MECAKYDSELKKLKKKKKKESALWFLLEFLIRHMDEAYGLLKMHDL